MPNRDFFFTWLGVYVNYAIIAMLYTHSIVNNYMVEHDSGVYKT